MARQSGRSARFRSAAEPGRGPELRAAAPRDPQPAGEREDVPQASSRARSSTCTLYEEHGSGRRRGTRRSTSSAPAGTSRSRSGSPRSACRSQVLVDIRPVVRPALVNDSLDAVRAALGRARRPRPERDLVPLGAADDRRRPPSSSRASASATSPRATPARPACPRSRSTSSRRPTSASTSPSPTSRRSSASARGCCGRAAWSASASTSPTTTPTSTRASRATTSSATTTARWRLGRTRRSSTRTGCASPTTGGSWRAPGSRSCRGRRRCRRPRSTSCAACRSTPHFRDGYPPEELGVTVLSFVARRQ